jgi:hypothetical protein
MVEGIPGVHGAVRVPEGRVGVVQVGRRFNAYP